MRRQGGARDKGQQGGKQGAGSAPYHDARWPCRGLAKGHTVPASKAPRG